MINRQDLLVLYEKLRKKLTPSCKCHFFTLVQFVVTSLFSLLPLLVDSAVQSSLAKSNFVGVFVNRFFADSVFIYTSAFIAPFFILTCIHLIREKSSSFAFYPLVALMSVYSLLLGALFYSGVVSRELYDFGTGSTSPVSYPTKADISIFITTLFSWYYCTYKATYKPNDSLNTYEENEQKNRRKFDKELRDA
ncbi:hypothetical protein ABDK09_13015 [Vibrio sp. CDRSL-10 TSBA]